MTRDELRERLWPGDTFVEFDKSLGVALTKVRAALGDDAANPRFIETVPKRGYRFIAPVTVETPPAASRPEPATPTEPVTPSRRRRCRRTRVSHCEPAAFPPAGRSGGCVRIAAGGSALLAVAAVVIWRSVTHERAARAAACRS